MIYTTTHIGHHMKRLRAVRGLSAASLARELEVSRVYVGKLERGEKTPSLERLISIARALSCTPHELLEEGNEP